MKHIGTVIASCACTLYSLWKLRAHSMPQASLQLVFRATALAKLRYASPARWDFANAAKRNRLKAILRRAGKWGYYRPTGDSLPTVATLRTGWSTTVSLDQTHTKGSVAHALTPSSTVNTWASTPYHTRACLHNYEPNFHKKLSALMSVTLSTVHCIKTVFLAFQLLTFFYLVGCCCALCLTAVCLLIMSIKTSHHHHYLTPRCPRVKRNYSVSSTMA